MSYTPLFNPPDESLVSVGDPVYIYTPKVKLAVNVAMATGRPLLLRGKPGTGKSTLARHVAWWLKRRYYHEVITSRTRAQDLQWHFDALRRLQDAQALKEGQDLNPVLYINPGVLWWALVAHGGVILFHTTTTSGIRARRISQNDLPSTSRMALSPVMRP